MSRRRGRRWAIPAEVEFWLVRHGRTSAVDKGIFQGRSDFALTISGICEAARLSQYLSAARKFDLLLSSDLKRAWSTAKIISRGIKLAPLREPLLRECSFGYIEGMKRSEVKTLYPELFQRRSEMLRAHRCGGESERRLLSRGRTLRRKIIRDHPGKRRILLVSHGRFINAFIAGCLGYGSRQRWPYAPAPASISVVRGMPAGAEYRLMLFNDVGHLKREKECCIPE